MDSSLRPLRIVFLTRSLDCGGTERQLTILAKGLGQNGHFVSIVCLYNSKNEWIKEMQGSGISLHFLNKQGRWDIIRVLFRLLSILQQEKPDILHSYLPISNLLTLLMKPFLAKTKIVWGVRCANMDLSYYDWFIRLSYFLEAKLARFADLIIANSDAGRQHAISHGFPKKKTISIPNGIDTQSFAPNPSLRQKIRSQWGIAENQILLGLVGRIDPIKDHVTFLKAASILIQKRPQLHFVCIGNFSSSQKERLDLLIQSLGITQYFSWIDQQDDMPAIYNAMDILCSSSLSEGFSNVVAEAMSCGVPCVVTNVGDSARIVGEWGVVVPPRDPEALAMGCLKIMNSPDLFHNPQIRQRIVFHFPLSALIERTEKALLEIF